MARPLPLLVTVVALTATFLAGTTVTADAAGHKHHAKTKFALTASGYGSQVTGGASPVNSDQTAFNVIACTNKEGVKRENYVANATLPGLGTVAGVRTDMWTEKKGSTVSSYSTHSIAKIVLGSSGLGSVTIRGVESLARAYHQGTKYKASTQTSIASIFYTPQGGSPQGIDIPAPNQPIVIPGLVRIAIGNVRKNITAKGSIATANVLDIKVIPTNTRVRIAQSRATIGGGVKHGLYKGYSAGLRVSALDDNVRVGRTPLTTMACQGTDGKDEVNGTAQVTTGLLDANGVYSGQNGTNERRTATGVEKAAVAHAGIASNAIQVDGVVAVANVKRIGGKLVSNDKGTKVLSLTVNGTAYDLKKTPTINIPGLAKIQADVVKKLKHGIRVIALQVTLLDGTGAVVDLGVAELQITRGADGMQ